MAENLKATRNKLNIYTYECIYTHIVYMYIVCMLVYAHIQVYTHAHKCLQLSPFFYKWKYRIYTIFYLHLKLFLGNHFPSYVYQSFDVIKNKKSCNKYFYKMYLVATISRNRITKSNCSYIKFL